jgi:3-mercaptopyruvate sulfurtransferase SseA
MRTISTIAVLALATVASAQFKSAAPAGAPSAQQAAAPQTSTAASDPLAAARRISIAEAQKLVAAKKAVFVDVRGTEAYDKGHIKGALNISGSDLSKKLKDIPKGRMIITYCA